VSKLEHLKLSSFILGHALYYPHSALLSIRNLCTYRKSFVMLFWATDRQFWMQSTRSTTQHHWLS